MTGPEQASYTAACALGLAQSALSELDEERCVRHLIDAAGDQATLDAAVSRVEQLELTNEATRGRAIGLLDAAQRLLMPDGRERDQTASPT